MVTLISRRGASRDTHPGSDESGFLGGIVGLRGDPLCPALSALSICQMRETA